MKSFVSAATNTLTKTSVANRKERRTETYRQWKTEWGRKRERENGRNMGWCSVAMVAKGERVGKKNYTCSLICLRKNMMNLMLRTHYWFQSRNLSWIYFRDNFDLKALHNSSVSSASIRMIKLDIWNELRSERKTPFIFHCTSSGWGEVDKEIVRKKRHYCIHVLCSKIFIRFISHIFDYFDESIPHFQSNFCDIKFKLKWTNKIAQIFSEGMFQKLSFDLKIINKKNSYLNVSRLNHKYRNWMSCQWKSPNRTLDCKCTDDLYNIFSSSSCSLSANVTQPTSEIWLFSNL